MTALTDFTDAFDTFKTAAETYAADETATATVTHDGHTFLFDLTDDVLVGLTLSTAEGAVAACAAAAATYAAANRDTTFVVLGDSPYRAQFAGGQLIRVEHD